MERNISAKEVIEPNAQEAVGLAMDQRGSAWDFWGWLALVFGAGLLAGASFSMGALLWLVYGGPPLPH